MQDTGQLFSCPAELWKVIPTLVENKNVESKNVERKNIEKKVIPMSKGKNVENKMSKGKNAESKNVESLDGGFCILLC